MPTNESDRQILSRLDERVLWLVKNMERLNNHAERIGSLERFRSYTLGIVAASGGISGGIFLLMRFM